MFFICFVFIKTAYILRTPFFAFYNIFKWDDINWLSFIISLGFISTFLKYFYCINDTLIFQEPRFNIIFWDDLFVCKEKLILIHKIINEKNLASTQFSYTFISLFTFIFLLHHILEVWMSCQFCGFIVSCNVYQAWKTSYQNILSIFVNWVFTYS